MARGPLPRSKKGYDPVADAPQVIADSNLVQTTLNIVKNMIGEPAFAKQTQALNSSLSRSLYLWFGHVCAEFRDSIV
eukprot:5657051-Amphidinium_carterae.1